MSLFSALWPPPAVVEHLDRAFRQVSLPVGVRPTPAASWHLTLAFYGHHASPAERAGFLDGQLAGRSAPALRLAGAGTFAGVLWVGVEPVTPADRQALRLLGTGAGGGRRFQPHVTVARWRLEQPGELMVGQLRGYRGPVWTAAEVHLVRSETTADRAPAYTTVHRVPLVTW